MPNLQKSDFYSIFFANVTKELQEDSNSQDNLKSCILEQKRDHVSGEISPKQEKCMTNDRSRKCKINLS